MAAAVSTAPAPLTPPHCANADDGDEDECDGAEGGPKSTAGLRAEAEKLRCAIRAAFPAFSRPATHLRHRGG